MKKNISLALIFVFAFSLALYLPAQAEDSATSTSNEAVVTTTTTSAEVTNFNDISKEDRTKIDTSKYERIPSPDYIKYFREIIKKENTLYGVRINPKASGTAMMIQENKQNGTSTLEKIHNPENISLFEKIKKIGDSLFGVRKSDDMKKPEEQKKAENMASSSLEKISSPAQMSLFEKITKIGTSLFGIRKNPIKQLPLMSTSTIACVSTAIDAKDLSVSTAFTKSATEISAAMIVRGTCQKAALTLTQNEKNTGITNCNKAFQETSKKSHENAKVSQKTAWDVYRADLKVCANANEGSSAEIMIEDGGQEINNSLIQ